MLDGAGNEHHCTAGPKAHGKGLGQIYTHDYLGASMTTEEEINNHINSYSGAILMSDLLRCLLTTLVDSHLLTMGQIKAMLTTAADRGIPHDRG